MQWDIFCRVVDYFGDIGICWRLAADLASRGECVRLWVDDASALQWMAPHGAPDVTVLSWAEAAGAAEAGDVVLEAFGCDPPPSFVEVMAARAVPPVWINFEYLSAQDYVLRSHGLRSPQFFGPGQGLPKWFYYPGFTAGTGGLIRETDLCARMQNFMPAEWLASIGAQRTANERVVSLFCYDNPALPELLGTLAQRPTLLLATADKAAEQVRRCLGATLRQGALRACVLPWLSQRDYDHLLWASELNFVRGEDSFVRAQWAGAPFVWQAYPQPDDARIAKLEAFLDRFLDAATEPFSGELRRLWATWNGVAPWPVRLPSVKPWRVQTQAWTQTLLAQRDLGTQLVDFVAQRS